MRRISYVCSVFIAATATCLGLGGCGDDTAAPVAPADSAVTDTATVDTAMPDTAVPDASDTATPDTTVLDATDATDATDVADTAVADVGCDSGGGDASTTTCGCGPFQLFDPIQPTIVADTPKTEVTVTASNCPATKLVIPYKGKSAMYVQREVPFFFTSTQTGNLTAFGIEYNVKSSFFSALPNGQYLLPSTYPATIDSAWDATKMALLQVMVTAATGTGICKVKDGVTYTVPGHPEAIIKYKGGGTSTDVSGTGTSILLVTTGTVAAPEYVSITQTKAGCKVDLNGAEKLFLTGRAPIAINTITQSLAGEVTD